MIERAINAAMTPLQAFINALIMRFEIYDRGQGVTTEVTTLKADVFKLRKDVDHLRSTDFTSLFGMVEIPADSSVETPACSEVPPATTGDDTRADVDVVESEAEIDEEQLEVRYKIVCEDLVDLKGAMFKTAR
ncbi:uncharacterized protein LOC125863766 [Solanum stenotomum]|uniref:uncharacterized protein LOC125863766 n=1 Tax=Solanum stenotomum TaxID=172797 RepID=UPI0020D17C2D|nr:uncharacterized protein LOC125863766 [Solanum stenotomum]